MFEINAPVKVLKDDLDSHKLPLSGPNVSRILSESNHINFHTSDIVKTRLQKARLVFTGFEHI